MGLGVRVGPPAVDIALGCPERLSMCVRKASVGVLSNRANGGAGVVAVVGSGLFVLVCAVVLLAQVQPQHWREAEQAGLDVRKASPGC